MDINLVLMTEDDLEMVRNWRNSIEVSQFMYSSDEITVEQQLEWWNNVKNDKTSTYWIVEYNAEKIGVANLTGISSTLKSCFWAFYLGDNVPKGGGIGSKIEYNILEYVFNELKLNKLRCEVLTFNDKVISMHEKFGFRREAYFRQHVKKGGRWIDSVGLAILKDDWDKQKEYMKKIIYR